jgi:hypothetical protein
MRFVPLLSVAALALIATAPHSSHQIRRSLETKIVNGYPPCSRTVIDRCIQLYERGVATAANLALNEKLPPGRTLNWPAGPEAPVAASASLGGAGGSAWDAPTSPEFDPACRANDAELCRQPTHTAQGDGALADPWVPSFHGQS